MRTEILIIFLPAFKKAVDIVNQNGGEIKIISETRKEINLVEMDVEADNAYDFYQLGLKFGILKAQI